jgi:hypothetical protein
VYLRKHVSCTLQEGGWWQRLTVFLLHCSSQGVGMVVHEQHKLQLPVITTNGVSSSSGCPISYTHPRHSSNTSLRD